MAMIFSDRRCPYSASRNRRVSRLCGGFLKKHPVKNVLDVCTGSGIIAIALKKAFPDISVTASDISAPALAVAKKNALLLNADVRFVETDLLEAFKQTKNDSI